ncbi:hypothetical protein [Microcoleus sp. K5-D4]|uniref:hypothetical protein n=1 Tax=Microcoleus sp. K5-D4 TaxID=2818801 RepID=UPI002FD3BD25
MLIQQGTLPFAPTKGAGPQTAEQALNFPQPVTATATLISGFDIMYTGRTGVTNDGTKDEHEVQLIHVDLRSRNLSSQSVEVTGEFGLRDNSNNWDDGYAGAIRFVLLGGEQEEILGGTFNFPPAAGNVPRTMSESVNFSTEIQANITALSGFQARYPQNDTNFFELDVELQTQLPSPNQVQVSGSLGLRDDSPTDVYEGFIRYATLAEIVRENSNFQIRSGRLDFAFHSGSGPLEQRVRLSFPRNIGNCAAVMTGFNLSFDSRQDDHPLHRATVNIEARKLSDREIEVVGHLALRDASGDWDDPYRGSIQFAVLAE